ncbi:MAG TPA: hypothetical protein VF796_01410 [Humisphaera sp.]
MSLRLSSLLLPRSPLARHGAALTLCLLLAGVYLLPYLPNGLVKNGELYGYIGGVADARNALAEGQFPIRVPPSADVPEWSGETLEIPVVAPPRGVVRVPLPTAVGDRARYPVYQFYANLPYTLSAVVPERSPYAAWKWAMFATLTAGGWSAYALAWRWTRRHAAAMAAAGVYLSAPYLFTDLHDRGAMAELTALCLLPLALLATWACFTRGGFGRVVGAAVAWSAVALSHNITYLYGATFAALLVLSFVSPRRRMFGRVLRLAAAGALHAGLVAWYLAPQVALMPRLRIGQAAGVTPWWSRELTTLDVLLSPVVKTPATSTVPRLGLQVGWLVLAGLLTAIACAVVRVTRRTRTHGRAPRLQTPTALRWGLLARLLPLWASAFVIAWQPVDLWGYLPRAYQFVQFSYRLLGFTSLFGALLAGLAVATLPRGRAKTGAAVIIAAGAVLTSLAYFPRYGPDMYHPTGSWRWVVNRPEMAGGNDAYQLVPTTPTDPPADVPGRMPIARSADARKPGGGAVFDLKVDQPTWATLPVLHYPDMLRVTVDGAPARAGASGKWVAVAVPPGRHELRVWFAGLAWANAVSLAAWGVAGAGVTWAAWRAARKKR